MKNLIIFLFFLFIAFGIGKLYLDTHIFRGNYNDFLYYEIKNSDIYLRIYIDKLYRHKFAKEPQQSIKNLIILKDYPSIYSYFNTLQKEKITNNFWIKNYLRFFAKNGLKITAELLVYDKNVYIPYFLNYLVNSKMKAYIYFDKEINIENFYGKIKNDYLNLVFNFDKTSAKINLEMFINNLTFKNYFYNFSVFDLFVKLDYFSFPVTTLNIFSRAKKIDYFKDTFFIKLEDLKIEGNQNFFKIIPKQAVIKGAQEVVFYNPYLRIILNSDLRYLFNPSLDYFISDIEFLGNAQLNKIKINNLHLKTSFFYNRKFFNLFLKELFFDNLQGISFQKIEKMENYEFLGNFSLIFRKIVNLKKYIVNFILNHKKLTSLCILIDNENVRLVTKNLLIEFAKEGIAIFYDGLYLFKEQNKFFLYSGYEFIHLDLTNKKLALFSNNQNIFISFNNFFNIYWTDYNSNFYLSQQNRKSFVFTAFIKKSKIIENLLKILKIDNVTNIFKLNQNGIKLIGEIKKEKINLLFFSNNMYCFAKVKNIKSLIANINWLEHISNSKIKSIINLIFNNLEIFIVYENSYFLLSYPSAFINFNQIFFYFKIFKIDVTNMDIRNILLVYNSWNNRSFKISSLKNILNLCNKLLTNIDFIISKNGEFLVFNEKESVVFYNRKFYNLGEFSFLFEFLKNKSFSKKSLLFKSLLVNRLLKVPNIMELEGEIDENFVNVTINSLIRFKQNLFLKYFVNKKFSLQNIRNIIYRKNYEVFFEFIKNGFAKAEIYKDGELKLRFHFDSKSNININTANIYLNLYNQDLRDLLKFLTENIKLNENLVYKDLIFYFTRHINQVSSEIRLEFDKRLLLINLQETVLEIDYISTFKFISSGVLNFSINAKNIQNKSIFDIFKLNQIDLKGYFFDHYSNKFGDIYYKYNLKPDTLTFCLSFNENLLDFINLSSFVYFLNEEKINKNITAINLIKNKEMWELNINTFLKIKEFLFKNYRLKGLDFNSVLNMEFIKKNSFSIKNLKMNFKINSEYYLAAGDIYRKTVQNLQILLENNIIILDGKLSFSFDEILKYLGNFNKDVDKEIWKNKQLKDYLGEILSTGFLEIVFQNVKIYPAEKFINNLLQKNEKIFENKQILDFLSGIKLNCFFVLKGYEYFVEFKPQMIKKDNEFFKINKLKAYFYENYRFLGIININIEQKSIEDLTFYYLPSFIKDFLNYEGNVDFYINFSKNEFFANFDKFSFKILDNLIFVNGKMVMKNRGLLPPTVKVNSNEVKIGFDGKFVSVISKLNKLDIGNFSYKGELEVVMIINPDFKNLSINGNISVKKGVLNYKKYAFKTTELINYKVYLVIEFDKVRFKNSFIDIIFSGNLRYTGGKNIKGALKADKGFVNMVDGLYRIIQAYLMFNNEPEPLLYAVLQKLASNIFEYKVNILKGSLSNFNFEKFGFPINNDYKFDNNLSFNLYDIPILDLISLSLSGYTLQREVFPNIFVSFFSSYTNSSFSKLDYSWYYAIDWIISRFKFGVVSVNYREYSNGKRSVGFVFVKGF